MERLVDIDLNTAVKYILDITKAIDEIYQRGVVHYDISLNNLMPSHEGLIRVIDFGRAGYIGEEVLSYKIKGIKPPANTAFSIDADENALKEAIGMFTTLKSNF